MLPVPVLLMLRTLHNERMPLVRVTVTLKPSLLDSAGRTVSSSLQGLGYDEVTDVRIGKVVQLNVDQVDDARIKEMCKKLLSNPVIEDFTYEVVG
jgi:phosphoribosylformylglycinamidine synthase subunit PurS